FVIAPNREIDVPFVQLQGDISGRMRKIESDNRSCGMPHFRDSPHVQQLSGYKIDAAEHDQTQPLTFSRDRRLHVLPSDQPFAVPWTQHEQCILGIKSVKSDLRLNRVNI